MIVPLPIKCIRLDKRLLAAGFWGMARGLALVGCLSACSLVDPPPAWVTGDAPLPPMRPEIAGYQDRPLPHVDDVPERPIPPVTVPEREALRARLLQENSGSTADAMPLRSDIPADHSSQNSVAQPAQPQVLQAGQAAPPPAHFLSP